MTDSFCSCALSNCYVHNRRLDETHGQGDGTAATATQSRSAAAQRCNAGRSSAPRGSVTRHGVRLESAHRARWHCVTEQPSARPPGTARRGETRATGRSVARRRAITRICNRVVDLAAHCQADRGALRILIQHQPGLTASGGDGLELPTTRKARIATRREGHCAVEEQTLAGAKKNAAAQRRTIVFIDESGLSERPTRVRTWSPKAQTPVLQY